MRKVLIITYYWPPSGGSGVQRWLKFSKYLPGYGWEPHVFTPENPSFGITDESLIQDVPQEAEVIRFPIWEPYNIFQRISAPFGSGRKNVSAAWISGKERSPSQTLAAWIRGNFFIPDPRRFWIGPSVRFLSEYVVDNGIEAMVTTGPPHSLHLIGRKLKKKFPKLRWLADFRDPWSEWGLWDSLRVTAPVRRIHRSLEQRVLKSADEIITITPFYAGRFERLANRPVRLLTNGFDEDDFKNLKYSRESAFTIRHVGIVNEKCDPRPFMQSLQKEMTADPAFAADVRVEFIGEVHPQFRTFVSAHDDLKRITVFRGNIPHSELLNLFGSSALLLLILTGYKDAEGFLPGKLFEYLATRLPVLGVGPTEGDAAAVLRKTNAGRMVNDETGIREVLRTAYQHWKTGGRPEQRSDISEFSRREITGRLAAILSAR